MWGPSEFTMRGTLRDFDRLEDLHKLNQPVLFIIGEYDEVLPETAYNYQKRTPHAIVKIIEDAAHSQLHDQPQKYTETIRQFLRTVESD